MAKSSMQRLWYIGIDIDIGNGIVEAKARTSHTQPIRISTLFCVESLEQSLIYIQCPSIPINTYQHFQQKKKK